MDAPRKIPAQVDPAAPGNAAVSEFVDVMDELKSILAEENDLLSQGLPASVLETIGEKEQLSQKYGVLGNDLVDRSGGQILSDGALREKLLEASAELVAMTEENRQLLSNALAATRRRVDKVMDAIRTCEEDDTRNSDDQPSPRRG
ncbi:hypothetical protein [Telmatospirillum siberiense]|uniref:Flagellar protein FlgN n=1 Tax=Telmatospirillum siberiense TaxID=382514 RepID=A0A2N3Q034_9PROT|nr:hypothetical protein [Telmatospirillum siberiense]PKU26006.1 hypothetical protein CWS72_02355 [Telmatospirillum siberiense]